MAKRPVNIGDIVTIELESLAHGGDVVGRIDGFAIFVPKGVPKEKVKVKITQVKKSYGRGEILEVIDKSEHRITPSCPFSQNCGGCQIQHINYQAQLEHKREIVRDNIERIGKLQDIKVNPVKGMDNPFFYRNKAQFPLGLDSDNKVITGFYAPGSHDIVDINDCGIQHPLINRISREAINLIEEYGISIYDEKAHEGLMRHLVIRVGVCTNQAMLIFVTKDNKFPEGREMAERLMTEIPELVSVQHNINPKRTNVVLGKLTKTFAGQDHIFDYIGKVKYKISPLSFFQVNTLQAKVLYDQAVDYAGLTGQEKVIDAYCGLGSITLYVADQAKEVYGIEIIEEAIEAAKENAQLNEIENCHFQAGKMREVLPELKKDFIPEVIIVDPPRKGCHEDVLKSFVEMSPERIVYVSCNPSSLARDLKYLDEHGYKTVEIQPVDMFPQTYHIESVALIKRVDS
ncbi:23S rRNA m(5)U-1939 methyltransferase [Orenia metallireducens]|jgi:23S rRNA (uracil1939-C5)-methyltransferase|uniref:23S rRNA m(5)U-1939 methyltransferase n=1 Tax=Orenia metallireducens TaxID=1413210 RepID=A0A285GBU1_9FIRM|nr:23S rRNA (uracil(1939)-C(5))-methyltransferase RlmD [Orenia metallireducens]PRX32550.1 23S rRNA m(5)U-1939 methyltransferase [Orenia metallireducens]SNY20878.1 23S rRNA m(5)U-1939 methyltransferase [Orenia metallireducens]